MIRQSLTQNGAMLVASAVLQTMLLPGCSNAPGQESGSATQSEKAQVVYCLVDLRSGDAVNRTCVAEKMLEISKIRQDDVIDAKRIIGRAVKNDLRKGDIIRISDLSIGAPLNNRLLLSEEGSEKLMNIAQAKGLSGPELATEWVVEKLKSLKDPVKEQQEKVLKEVEAEEKEAAATMEETASDQKKAKD